MKNTAKKTNVLHIADNKRFKEVAVPQTTEEFELKISRFGFPIGSTLICRTTFDYSEITGGTLVLLHSEGDYKSLGAGRYPEKGIYAVVDYVKVDVRK